MIVGRYIGYGLLALPFLGMAILISATSGPLTALAIFAVVGIIVGVIALGAWLALR